MVTEFCSGGSLRSLLINSRINPSENSPDYINMTSTLNHRELLKLAVDIASGMAHLSSQKVCVVISCREGKALVSTWLGITDMINILHYL